MRSKHCAEAGDVRAFYLPLPAVTADTLGARQHPEAACHQQAADILSRFLDENLCKKP